ncbi:MAG TPA: hypothetical protein VHX52_02270 [Steroidobacteraceae bacterium]|jgi:hypothetical protein|nr:hypothetical protein [Steroidobacteraceae bacterium]
MSRRTPRVIATLAVGIGVGVGLSVAHAQSKTSSAGLTGLWETELSVALANGEIDRIAANAPAKAPRGGRTPLEVELFKRMKLQQTPPYNTEWARKSEQASKRAAPAHGTQLLKACSPGGFPAVMESFAPDGMFQAVITRAETLFLFPDGEVRQIYTDGRTHPGRDDLWPTIMGDSIGHWAGATLVIDTIARKAGPISPLASPGMANLSDQTHFTERVRLLDTHTLQDDMTIDDPQRFSHPWKVSVRYKRVTDVDRMITTNCTENDRDAIVDGKQTIVPP